MFGYVMENELKAIDGIMLNPQRPFCAILGGSKVSTKISVIENLMKRVDNLILGGGMTYTFKAAQGGNAACMMNTAILYARGEGTPHNAREALYWAEQAKKHGAPQAEQLINAIKKNG